MRSFLRAGLVYIVCLLIKCTPSPLKDHSNVKEIFHSANVFESASIEGVFASVASKTNILILGDAHQNQRIAADFKRILEAIELQSPGRLNAIGLEVFSVYQSLIDGYLASSGSEADEKVILDTPDREALRGSRDKIDPITQERSPVTSQLMLDIYRTVFAINRSRPVSNKIHIVALDSRPETELTFREFQKNPLAMLRWAFSRDAAMFENLKTSVAQAVERDQLVAVLIGSAHAQRSGLWRWSLPPSIPSSFTPGPTKWLATRLAESFPKVTTADQIQPGSECADEIELRLRARGVATPLVIDLKASELGSIEAYARRCFPEGIQVKDDPVTYRARDHYDYYTYYPAQ